MSDLERALRVFINESLELTDDIEQALLDKGLLKENFAEWIDELFRGVHTIKGSAGLFGLDEVTTLTHIIESLLDQVRQQITPVDDELIEVLIESNDVVRKQIIALNENAPLPNAELVAQRLLPYIIEPATPSAVDATNVEKTPPIAEESREGMWHISFRPHQGVFQDGLDPIRFIQFLSTKGQLEHVELMTAELDKVIESPESQFNPEKCYVGFELRYRACTSNVQIMEAFEFVQHDADITVMPPDSPAEDYFALIERLPEESRHLAELFTAMGVLTQQEFERFQSLSFHTPQSNFQPRIKTVKTLRVEADKLDKLIDLVGEMVIMGARTNLLAHQTGSEPLVESMALLERLVESIRDSSLQLRMVQIGDTFSKFKRIVRDTAQELGKQVELVVSGAETELDKTFVEKLSDPLTHLVRNAIDHGMESAAERISAGKAPVGTIRLNAYHDSGSIVIEVVDDGKGIDENKVLEQAKRSGLINEHDTVTKRELWKLIFEPGFSTSEQVTDLSGRGVGMDVVKRNIELLRGNIEVNSQSGKGSRFVIRLPLTLSIVDGFMFKVTGGEYVIPLDNVVECLELKEVMQDEQDSQRRFVNLRDEVLPFLRLSEWFGVEAHSSPEQEALIVVQLGSMRAGLVVDSLSGEFQTVVKSLGPLFEGLRGVSGATILGSGEVAIILDIFALVQTALSPSERVNVERFN
ncbi:chemotaxis protein CheA [Vibrio europaeus]|uniref:chemotaxis protein CheA n=1 Tax=Vibrio europaeus TaxID=300876 RepID=UPI00148DA49D|nr:chemotaxis protein CheA [Vibrio europaeus]NOH24023.1 chemotaxis protein CheA [Vibrio europaeus]